MRVRARVRMRMRVRVRVRVLDRVHLLGVHRPSGEARPRAEGGALLRPRLGGVAPPVDAHIVPAWIGLALGLRLESGLGLTPHPNP